MFKSDGPPHKAPDNRTAEKRRNERHGNDKTHESKTGQSFAASFAASQQRDRKNEKSRKRGFLFTEKKRSNENNRSHEKLCLQS